MSGDLRALGKETVVYGLSTVLARLLNFLLLPFYTHFLAPGEYGAVAVLFSYIAFANYLFQYGMDQAYMRYASDKDGPGAEACFSTAWLSLAATTLALSGVLMLGANHLARLGGISDPLLVRYAAGILALDALTIVPFAALRLAHRRWMFVGIKSFHIVLNVLLNILLIGKLGFGVKGVFLASLTAAAASLVLLAPVFAQYLRAHFDKHLWRNLLRFGLPLVPAGIGAMMVQVIDRPILQHYAGEAAVGIYQANYKLGIFMVLVVTMFDYAWRPFFLERKDRADAPRLFAQVLTYFTAAAGWIALALSLFIGDIVQLEIMGARLIHPDYWGGLSIVPIVLCAYVFHGMYINFIAQVTIAKRTDLLVWVTLLGAAVNIGMNLWLIPQNGISGAAWATFAAYAAMALALFACGQRVWPIPYEYGRLAGLAAVLALCGVAAAYSQTFSGPWSMTAAARLGILMLAPGLLLVSGFFSDDELRALRAQL
jgi:O-antigen/teichoic acid export membrane protein